jgi:hypothetical protein
VGLSRRPDQFNQAAGTVPGALVADFNRAWTNSFDNQILWCRTSERRQRGGKPSGRRRSVGSEATIRQFFTFT